MNGKKESIMGGILVKSPRVRPKKKKFLFRKSHWKGRQYVKKSKMKSTENFSLSFFKRIVVTSDGHSREMFDININSFKTLNQ